jgi:ABC-type uncharacterized transport system auxiliary subunit
MFKQSHRLWAIASALALTPWLAACGGLFDTERPAARTYWLTPVAEVSAPAPKPRISFELSAVPGLDTDRVLVLGADSSLRPLGDARWADYLPEVLDSVLRRSLAAHGMLSREHGHDEAGEFCSLALQVQQFFALSRGGQVTSVRVVFAGELGCGAALRAIRVATEVPAAAGEQRVIAAFQKALDQATSSLLGQLTEDVSAP